jgi:DNA polymerase elongation subunit (family B)
MVEIPKKTLKENSWHIKVKGAYVQQPVAGIYGLEDDSLINSTDAAALYPNVTVFSNISPETLFGRVYDPSTVLNFVQLVEKVFQMKKTKSNTEIINLVIPSFRSALLQLLKVYSTHNNVKNKKDAELVTTEYYCELLKKIINYDGKLVDIYTPIDDKTYYLLRSCYFPLIESISWLSPQNKGFSQIIIDYIFYPELFETKYAKQDLYLFTEYNNVGLNFKKLSKDELKEYFKKYLLNSYGTLFYTHEEKLSFEVQLIIDGLAERRVVKNKMLVLDAILAKFKKANLLQKLFETGVVYLTPEQADEILNEIEDDQPRKKRITSLIDIDLENKTFNNWEKGKAYISIRKDQFNSNQNGIKVSLNSGYGILGMISYEFSDPLAANSITNGGKIFGIKVFQTVSAWVIEKYQDKLEVCDKDTELENPNWIADDWIDLELIDPINSLLKENYAT